MATILTGRLTQVTATDGGSGYQLPPAITNTDGGGGMEGNGMSGRTPGGYPGSGMGGGGMANMFHPPEVDQNRTELPFLPCVDADDILAFLETLSDGHWPWRATCGREVMAPSDWRLNKTGLSRGVWMSLH